MAYAGTGVRLPDERVPVSARTIERPAARVWLHRYAVLLVSATLLLIAAGGMVTSTSSGLSVPDWPTTYGYTMFSFPLRDMAGGIFYEHGHRLIASTVGFLTIGLVIFIWLADPRAWMRRLGLAALGAVVLQGLLGGLTVLLRLPAAVSIAHAALAQAFFCLTIATAVCTSSIWRAPHAAPRVTAMFPRWAAALTLLVYAQILLGATMRHLGAGLAIPDFPLAFGHLVPPAWPLPVAIHFAHRVGALVVSLCVLAMAGHVWWHYGKQSELVRPALLLVLLVVVQVTLGALVVLSGRQPVVNTLHVATGAMVLGTSLVLTLRSFRAS
jgi:cytochrome c oxidase assembly protein subunit 15